jgi:hypothetical protein
VLGMASTYAGALEAARQAEAAHLVAGAVPAVPAATAPGAGQR